MIKTALDSELTKIVDISKDFGADRVLLFGSCLEDASRARDIDIAVSGVPARKFFEYYAEVSMAVKDEVDIVDLDDLDEHFSGRILSKGRVLYER
ncbi:MAG: hypothetical protein A3C36_03095 [Omnitrophica WOR_2 bacterium RIFCSPHIGHO2_02_FULL_52_10]|nr:MAG: hypothetical protein A3C36_03095 [Omnitrophica WOR_2 bacterium RIFCSPHIGHO2_02_FULL_52_10]